MTRSRAELEHWDRHHVWHAFTQMQEYEPLLIERGEGAWRGEVGFALTRVHGDGNDGTVSVTFVEHGTFEAAAP